ncbi:MAG: hypothetical protein ACK5LS_01565 [Propioniciclava sp.]
MMVASVLSVGRVAGTGPPPHVVADGGVALVSLGSAGFVVGRLRL